MTPFAFLLAGLLLLTGCCTKKGCISFNERKYLEFQGFEAGEADSIEVLKYLGDVQSQRPVDSVRLPLSSLLPSYSDYSDLNSDHNYKITVLPVGKEYLLSEIEVERKVCNKCFPVTPKSEYYETLHAYKVNGKRQEGSLISISK